MIRLERRRAILIGHLAAGGLPALQVRLMVFALTVIAGLPFWIAAALGIVAGRPVGYVLLGILLLVAGLLTANPMQFVATAFRRKDLQASEALLSRATNREQVEVAYVRSKRALRGQKEKLAVLDRLLDEHIATFEAWLLLARATGEYRPLDLKSNQEGSFADKVHRGHVARALMSENVEAFGKLLTSAETRLEAHQVEIAEDMRTLAGLQESSRVSAK